MITCAFENGNEANLRHAVLDAVIMQNNKILLAKRTKSLLEGGQWGLIGGYMERDETLEEGIRREVFEETGYELAKVTLVRINGSPNRRGEDHQNISFLFYCEAGELTGQPDWESEDLQWLEPGRLPHRDQIVFDHADSMDFCLGLNPQVLPGPVVI